MFNSFCAWIGRQVVLQIESGDSRVPLRGRVVNESNRAALGSLGDFSCLVAGAYSPVAN
jgi:hypothetical protein